MANKVVTITEEEYNTLKECEEFVEHMGYYESKKSINFIKECIALDRKRKEGIFSEHYKATRQKSKNEKFKNVK